MNPPFLPYPFTVAVLAPAGVLPGFGGERGARLACQGKSPEGAGFRTVAGSP